jgi:hypothetical protein
VPEVRDTNIRPVALAADFLSPMALPDDRDPGASPTALAGTPDWYRMVGVLLSALMT